MSKRQYIADLQHQDKIAEVYLCTRKNLSIDRNGKRFLCLALSDRSGEIEAILWEDAERRADRFSQFDLVEAQGTVMVYQGRMQIHLHDIRCASSAGLVIEEFLHASSMDVEQMWSELCILLGTVEDPHLAQLLKYYTSDPVFKRQLQLAPAAKSIHHAYIGGLLEHTLSVVQLTAGICQHYQKAMPGLLNRDLCLTGAFLHDLGKIDEISTTPGFHYTHQGRLLGHLIMGVQGLDQRISSIDGFPPELADQLRHLIISHHGKLEYGSPKRPKTGEAFVIHQADDLDGHLEYLRELFSQNNADGWTAYQPLYDQYFFHGWPCGDVKKVG